jgi:glycosyltransferase involved in cell wall biosynthesis
MILGDGPRHASLLRLARDLGVAGDVALPGFVGNPYAYMSRAALLVLSSAWEGFGNVLVEAMSCGCPVVSTDCASGPAEILQDGRYGPLVPVGDTDALANAIAATLDESLAPEKLKERAGEFTAAASAAQYERLLFGPPRAGSAAA